MVVLPLPDGPEKTQARPRSTTAGRVQQDAALSHEEEAAQKAEQVGVERRTGPTRKRTRRRARSPSAREG